MQSLKPPLHLEHDIFEGEVTAWLEGTGFACGSATYHNALEDELRALLSARHSPTALYLRGRADRIAVHRTRPLEFEYECKTHDTPGRGDLLVELPPIAYHLMHARTGVECLYVYLHNGVEKGFWLSEMPTPRVIMIPDRWGESHIAYFRAMAQTYFDSVPVRTGVRTNGSGDPFLVIDRSQIDRLHNWRDLVGMRLAR